MITTTVRTALRSLDAAADRSCQFLADWDGVRPRPCKVNAATATFSGGAGKRFGVARAAKPSGGGGGRHPATATFMAPGQSFGVVAALASGDGPAHPLRRQRRGPRARHAVPGRRRGLLARHDVRVVTSGGALAYLRERLPRVEQVFGPSFAMDHGEIRRWATVRHNLATAPRELPATVRHWLATIDEWRPEVVVTDFEPLAGLYARSAHVPLVSVDNIHMIDRCRHDEGIVGAEHANFAIARAVTRAMVPTAGDYVITTFFRPPVCRGRTTLVDTLLRPEVLAAAPVRGEHLLVYSGGEPGLLETLGSAPLPSPLRDARAGFTLDEFALWVRLQDVYWSEEGRSSFDAVVATVAFGLLVVLGTRPFGLDDPTSITATAITVAVVGSLAVVCFAKGRVAFGVIAIFIPLVALVVAPRLGRPSSPWAKYFYKHEKLERARRRFADDRPLVSAQRRVGDLIAGAPSKED